MSKRVVCILPEETAEEILKFIREKSGHIERITQQKDGSVPIGREAAEIISQMNKLAVSYKLGEEILFYKRGSEVNIVIADGHKRRPKFYLFSYDWNLLQQKLLSRKSVITQFGRNCYSSTTVVVKSYQEAANWLGWDWRAAKAE